MLPSAAAARAGLLRECSTPTPPGRGLVPSTPCRPPLWLPTPWDGHRLPPTTSRRGHHPLRSGRAVWVLGFHRPGRGVGAWCRRWAAFGDCSKIVVAWESSSPTPGDPKAPPGVLPAGGTSLYHEVAVPVRTSSRSVGRWLRRAASTAVIDTDGHMARCGSRCCRHGSNRRGLAVIKQPPGNGVMLKLLVAERARDVRGATAPSAESGRVRL